MHQPLGGIGGTASDIKIQAEQMLFIKKRMASLIADHSGQTVEQIEKDSDRDRWFTAEEAREYGLIDFVYSMDVDDRARRKCQVSDVPLAAGAVQPVHRSGVPRAHRQWRAGPQPVHQLFEERIISCADR